MKKRLVLTTAAILSLGLLASCGGKKAEETTTKAETTAAATEKAGETTAAATEAEKTKSDLGGELNIVATSEDYKKLFDKFTAETGIKTNLLSKSFDGRTEAIAKIKTFGVSVVLHEIATFMHVMQNNI